MIGGEVAALGLLVGGILTLFSLSAKGVLEVLHLDALLVMDSFNLGRRLCLDSCGRNVLGKGFELAIGLAEAINFYGRNIKSGCLDSGQGPQLLWNDLLACRRDSVDHAFNLKCRDALAARQSHYDGFDLSCDGCANLSLEVLYGEVLKAVEFDELAIVGDSETDGSPYCRGHAKIWKARVKQVKVGDSEWHLHGLGKVNEVDLCLKGAVSAKGQADEACDAGEV